MMLTNPSAELFDEDLIKARRHPHADMSLRGSAPGELTSNVIVMPEPKVWQRTSKKKQVPCNAVVPSERSTRGANDDDVPVRSYSEWFSTDTDEWSRCFLFVIELNEL
jgi:hypothetical protein